MPHTRSRAALVAACAAMSIAPAFASDDARAAAPEVATPTATTAHVDAAPAWWSLPLTAVDGRPAGLTALHGKPVLLQFWASWCGSCGGLMWELDSLSAAHPQAPYFAVSIDAERGDAARVTAHPLHARHPGRYLHDTTGELARRLQIQAVPTLVVLDATGTERLRHVGHVNSSDLQKLRRMLAEVTTSSPHEATP